jgi:hypothetical protein
MQFSVFVLQAQRDALDVLMKAEKAKVDQWWKHRRRRIAEAEKPSDRSRLRGHYREQFAAAQRDGRLITCRDTLIVPAVAAELDDRGWHGPYDPMPDSARGAGRPWGSTGLGEGARYRVLVRLPAELGQHLQCACYWEMLDRVNQLEAFYDIYGDSPALPDPRPGEQPDAQAARYRDQLRAEIVTTGDILRAAIDRVTTKTDPPSHSLSPPLSHPTPSLTPTRERSRG